MRSALRSGGAARSPPVSIGRGEAAPKKRRPPDSWESSGLPGISQLDRDIVPPARVQQPYDDCALARYYKCCSGARNMAHVARRQRKAVSGPGFLRAPEPPTWVQVF